jgi:hypothetical protein
MMLKREAASRNLTDRFLARAPIPRKGDDGKWKRLNIVTSQYETIGR